MNIQQIKNALINISGTTCANGKFTAREAVEEFYQQRMDENYFPQEDGSIQDCDGNEICSSDDDDESIYFDGGYFKAELVEEE
jgi:hypothetical protein